MLWQYTIHHEFCMKPGNRPVLSGLGVCLTRMDVIPYDKSTFLDWRVFICEWRRCAPFNALLGRICEWLWRRLLLAILQRFSHFGIPVQTWLTMSTGRQRNNSYNVWPSGNMHTIQQWHSRILLFLRRVFNNFDASLKKSGSIWNFSEIPGKDIRQLIL